MPPPVVPEHVVLNTVVLDDVRLAYVPVPKAATTSVLGALFELSGGVLAGRVQSQKLEATRDLTIHDSSVWPDGFWLKERAANDRTRILESDDWFKFTVVREPMRRIWSAWVSKVLVRDPRFVLMFGEEWFPAVPVRATDVLESFREFVRGLLTRSDSEDPHWSSQTVLLGTSTITYHYVGRLESLAQTEADLRALMTSRGGRRLPAFGTENRSLLPFSPAIFDRRSHDACLQLTETDRTAFGYEPLEFTDHEPDEVWRLAVDSSIPAIRALIERHERLLDLWRMTSARGSTRRKSLVFARERASEVVEPVRRRLPRFND